MFCSPLDDETTLKRSLISQLREVGTYILLMQWDLYNPVLSHCTVVYRIGVFVKVRNCRFIVGIHILKRFQIFVIPEVFVSLAFVTALKCGNF